MWRELSSEPELRAQQLHPYLSHGQLREWAQAPSSLVNAEAHSSALPRPQGTQAGVAAGKHTSVARRTVRTRSPMRMPLSPAQATSVTAGSAYTTKPYLPAPQRVSMWR